MIPRRQKLVNRQIIKPILTTAPPPRVRFAATVEDEPPPRGRFAATVEDERPPRVRFAVTVEDEPQP